MIIGIIPARYASTRFPGKPLIDIEGKSMIQRVYEQASQAKCLSDVIVATDDERILQHVQAFGGKAIMTHPDHPSGTDRCWEAVQARAAYRPCPPMGEQIIPPLGARGLYIINIQGDEPFVAPQQIDELGTVLDGNVGTSFIGIGGRSYRKSDWSQKIFYQFYQIVGLRDTFLS